jgi:hypothetical protein
MHMGTNRAPMVVLAGARGAAGRMHALIHRSLGHRLVEFDSNGPPPSGPALRRIPWDEVILDVCTPTSVHARSMAWGYARGVRRFLIEKPAAASLALWQAQVATMPEAQIFVFHPYLYSRAYLAALDAVPAVTELTTTFDKDRANDDAAGRGAGLDGRLPHLFQVEAPHQFAMLLAAVPGLRVSAAMFDRIGARGADLTAPVAGTVILEDTQIERAVITTDLRSPRHRVLELGNALGARARVQFSTTSDHIARVWATDRFGRERLLFEEVDDLLRNSIVRAVDSFLRDGSAPWEASARFGGAVLARIDEAMLLGEQRRGVLPASTSVMSAVA